MVVEKLCGLLLPGKFLTSVPPYIKKEGESC